MAKSSEGAKAISNAFSVLQKSRSADAGGSAEQEPQKQNTVLPTARTRNAISMLARSTPQEIAEKEIPLRPLLQDLFNWDGKNHVNKPLIRVFQEALHTPGKYPHTVELTAFLAALAPLLEADQLARLYSLVHTVDSAFAPAKYTLNLHNRLKAVFSGYPQQRIEQLAASLWEQSHAGRWWNLTAGIDAAGEEMHAVQYDEKSAEDIFSDIRESFYGLSASARRQQEAALDWNPQYHEVFAASPMNREIALLSEEYRDSLLRGDFVHPDIAVYLSALPWLAPDQRPESPVGGLLKYLLLILKHTENRKAPKKPRAFSDLFPAIYLQAGALNAYPMPPQMRRLADGSFAGYSVRIIRSKAELAENAKFMQNCTLSYDDRLRVGKVVLLEASKNGDDHHNISLNLEGDGTWRLGEVNTRFNRSSDVDSALREELRRQLSSVTPESSDYMHYLSSVKESEDRDEVSFRYSLY